MRVLVVGVLKLDMDWVSWPAALAQSEAVILKLRLNEQKERSFQDSGIPNAAESRLAIELSGQLWKRKNLGKS
jgi:hypothetical protein